MYLGQRDSLLAPTDSTSMTRIGVSGKITSWREDNLDFPWHKFVEWFQQKYGSGIRTPSPQPELFYRTMEDFLSDIAQFEKELYGAVISDVPETVVREEEGFEWEDLEQPPQLPPDFYIPSPSAPEGFPWTYVAMGAGALVVVMLALKKKK